jgi:hypothetical protein
MAKRAEAALPSASRRSFLCHAETRRDEGQSMTDSAEGVLPDHAIRALIEAGAIRAETPIDAGPGPAGQPRPAAGNVAYRVRASFLTGRGRRLADRLPEFEMHRMALDRRRGARAGCVYVVPLMERWTAPGYLGGGQCQKLHRARRLPHARDHRRRDRVRPHRAGLQRAPFRRDLPAIVLGAGSRRGCG